LNLRDSLGLGARATPSVHSCNSMRAEFLNPLVVVFRLRPSHPDYSNRSGAKCPELSCSPSNLEAATVGRPCRRSATHSPVVSKRLSLRVRLSAHSSSSFCNPRTKVVSALRSACSHFTSTKYLLLSKNTVSGDALQCCVISKAVPETFVSYRVTVSLPAPS